MMAVELHRAGELLLCSSDQNDVDLGHDRDLDLDLSLSEKRFHNPRKPPWDFDSPNCNALSSHSSESHLASSTETETESDYCIAELTREMTRYLTRDPEKPKESTWDFGGWPYTTQPWSPFGSSYGSTEGSTSREVTPPASPEIKKRHVWDSNNRDNNITASMEKINILNHSSPTNKPNPRVLEDPTPDQIRAIQMHSMKQELLLRQQSNANRVKQLKERDLQYVKKVKGHPCEGGARQVQPRTNWANQQQGSGMRAVFLGGSGPTCWSSGTGVFLPCIIGATSPSRKKKGCSPVLIPAKVMQALKVHFDRMGNLSRQNAPNFPLQYDTYDESAKDGIYSQRVRVAQAVPAMTTQNDMGLPQDWTY